MPSPLEQVMLGFMGRSLNCFRQLQALHNRWSAAQKRRAALRSAIAEARNLVFRLIEKQAICATGQDGNEDEDIKQAHQLLQIFTKTSQLLEDGNTKLQSDLAEFETRAQVRQQSVQELYQHVHVFMETPSYAYPGSAAGAYNLESLSSLVGARF
jgi:hypothetical protein